MPRKNFVIIFTVSDHFLAVVSRRKQWMRLFFRDDVKSFRVPGSGRFCADLNKQHLEGGECRVEGPGPGMELEI